MVTTGKWFFGFNYYYKDANLIHRVNNAGIVCLNRSFGQKTDQIYYLGKEILNHFSNYSQTSVNSPGLFQGFDMMNSESMK